MSSFTDPQAIFMLFERLKPVDSAIARPLSNKRDYNTHNMWMMTHEEIRVSSPNTRNYSMIEFDFIRLLKDI